MTKKKLISLKIRIAQTLEQTKLSDQELDNFKDNFESPDLHVSSDLLIDDGGAKIKFEVTSVEVTNRKSLIAARVIELVCEFNKAESVIELLEEDFVLDDGQWEQIDIDKFMRYYFGDWEGVFIGDEMVDLESKVSLLEVS